MCVNAKSLQSCPTLYDPRDCSFPGSSVHGILQARAGCKALFQGIFPTHGSNLHLSGLPHWQAGSLILAPPGKPQQWPCNDELLHAFAFREKMKFLSRGLYFSRCKGEREELTSDSSSRWYGESTLQGWLNLLYYVRLHGWNKIYRVVWIRGWALWCQSMYCSDLAPATQERSHSWEGTLIF